MNRVCDHEGCERGIQTGHGLYRVSPKGPGQKFVGLCEEHYAGRPDPVVQTIEAANRSGSSREFGASESVSPSANPPQTSEGTE